MQETKFDVWSPVDDKIVLSRLFWIVGSLVSLLLLIVSLCIESSILALLDGLLPMGIILYGLIKHKKFPIYYYTTCLSGLYPICWYIFLSPDFVSEEVQKPKYFLVLTVTFIVVAAVILALFLVINIADRKRLTAKNAKKILTFDRAVLVLALIAIFATQFFAINVLFDKPYKTETVYVEDIRGSGGKSVVGIVDYIEANSGESHSIEFNDNLFTETEILKSWDTYDWVSTDQNGNYIFQIEYGNGALGIPWRRIAGNK